MPRALSIALAQLSPRLRQIEANIDTIDRVVAKHPEADLVVFPELFLSGYTVEHLEELSVAPDGPELYRISEIAREHESAVIFGAPERTYGGYANSAFYFDHRGDLIATYRKTHLFGDEHDAFVAGDELVIAKLKGFGIGLMVCFDVEFPEVAREFVRAGADLLVTISANMEPFAQDHDVFCTARALENGTPHIYVNQVGEGEEFTFTGGSMAVSADGDRWAESGSSGESTIICEIDLPMRSAMRPDYLQQVRPSLPIAAPRPDSAKEGPKRG